MNNPNVKLQDHYKLILSLNDKISFEAALNKHKISYYTNQNGEPDSGLHFTYFLLTKDRFEIDIILQENCIVAGTETIPTTYSTGNNKFMMVYLIVLGILVGLTYIVVMIEKLID